MTIRLLTDRYGYRAGSILTLDAGTEASLILMQEASADLTGGVVVQQVPPFDITTMSNVMARKNADDSVSFVWEGGESNPLATGGGAGDGSGGGSGDDVTAILAADANGRPTTVEVCGVPWVLTYVSDVPGNAGFYTVLSETITLATADSIVRLHSWDTDGWETVQGNIYAGGALLVSKAQAKALRDEYLVGLGAAAVGFSINVLDLGAVTDNANQTTALPGVLEWDGLQYRIVSGGSVETFKTFQFTGTGNSGTAATLVYPGWLLGKRGKLWVDWVVTNDGATAGTVQPFITVNGTNLVNSTSSSAASVSAIGSLLIQGNNSSTSQMVPPGGAAYQGSNVLTGTAYQTLSINVDTTDITATISFTNGTDATDPTTLRLFRLRGERA
jgi:hypothetical protein